MGLQHVAIQHVSKQGRISRGVQGGPWNKIVYLPSGWATPERLLGRPGDDPQQGVEWYGSGKVAMVSGSGSDKVWQALGIPY
jgi:hypothetical protein